MRSVKISQDAKTVDALSMRCVKVSQDTKAVDALSVHSVKVSQDVETVDALSMHSVKVSQDVETVDALSMRSVKCKWSGDLKNFKSQASYAGVPFCQNRYPNFHFEGWFGVTILGLNALAEIVLGMGWRNETDYKIGPVFVQHMVLLSCGVGRSAVVLFRVYKNKIPIEIEFLATGLTLYLFIPLFLAHISGKTYIDQMVHIVIALLCYVIGRITFYEMKHRNSLMASLGKCYFTALLGVWMFHAGDVLMHVDPFKSNLLMTKQNQLLYLSMSFIIDSLIVATVFVVLVANIARSTKACIHKA
ncbi:unnamed protein product [Cyprideis torosa]|uniref:Uncharacterized protein n=1 Tax=Cyprideis torosa TaxID=163714 RepID=A0A7R8WDC5_9CRUS|nr:unnamed protein product [Cyprideis torosa]CAG0894541.1 unnamed protein product [Cyprideis torosa]